MLEKHSKFWKIQRILAYCARFKNNSQSKKSDRFTQEFSVQEWETALRYCFKIIQGAYYDKEIQAISSNKELHKRSNLIKLAPFLDDNGLLRVGGRLTHAEIPFDEKHPIILPGTNSIIRSFVLENHLQLMHGGAQLMLSHLFRKYWITQAPRIVRSVTRSCIKCARYAARPGNQQMAPLPAARITPQRPFAVTGLDYAGPFKTLFSKGRGAKSIKSYVAIFVCFVTKAIHIEIVSDLTSTAFLAAFARFTARRGICSKLYSDNATTFKGAATELTRLFAETSDFVKTVKGDLAMKNTEWTFIPPRAPHFGGLWEAAVKSFKTHFLKVIGESTFTFEEVSTLAAKIEACLNSRPLCPLSTDPTITAALTPGHFLVGTPCLSTPEVFDKDERLSLSNRWRLLTQLRNSFWIRWRNEVLHHMQLRSKWIKPQPNFKMDDVVILKDELTPPGTWPLARIIELHPGKDGLVRAVTLKTAGGTFIRPIVKIIKLCREEDFITTIKQSKSE